MPTGGSAGALGTPPCVTRHPLPALWRRPEQRPRIRRPDTLRAAQRGAQRASAALPTLCGLVICDDSLHDACADTQRATYLEHAHPLGAEAAYGRSISRPA